MLSIRDNLAIDDYNAYIVKPDTIQGENTDYTIDRSWPNSRSANT